MPPEISAQPNSIMVELKKQTEHQHRRTESGLNLMDDNFTLDDYKNLLVRFYAFYAPYERKMSEMIDLFQVEFDYSARRNTPRLSADLQTLGLTEKAISEIELVNTLPALDSSEKIFGSLYVVEGSTLGGQLISRHLKEKFGLTETDGAAFFSGYGKETGKMWNEFKIRLTDFAENGANQAEIINSANETFEKIYISITE